MIPITPQILGPGIDEEYADAMERIEALESLLQGFPPSNDTREGRMVYQLKWLRQEIEARRLPIPLDRKYWSTLAYLVGEGSLDYLGGATAMGELDNILDGVGLLKKRHYPVVVAMLDEFLDLLNQATNLNSIEQKLIDEARQIRAQLGAGAIQLPIDYAGYPGWRSIYLDVPNLDGLPDFSNRRRAVELPLFEGWRPWPCLKGPLAAPNPGMVWGGP